MRRIRLFGLLGAVLVILTSPVSAQEDFCQTHSFYYLGDVNGDSLINMRDAIYLIKAHFGHRPGPSIDYRAADIDLNGRITLADILYLIKGALRKQGVVLTLQRQGPCCNLLYCWYCLPEVCQKREPLPRGKVSVLRDREVISEMVSDSAGKIFFLLPAGDFFDFIIYPPASTIDDLTLRRVYLEKGLHELEPSLHIDRFQAGVVLVKYDASYGEERMPEIFKSLGIVSWEPMLFGGWFKVILPDCLHVQEGIEMFKQYVEIKSAGPNHYRCLLNEGTE